VHHQRFFFYLGAIVTALPLIVGAVAFGDDAVKGVGLGIGIFAAVASAWFTLIGVGGAGLVAHELCTERLVHFLQAVEPSSPPEAAHES